MQSERNQVVVIGAGPTGLVMACELVRHGIHCRIIDKNQTISKESKALAIHARTLEVFKDMGVVEEVLQQGYPLKGVNIFVEGKRIAHFNFDGLNTPYPFVCALPQNNTEAILEQHLKEYGIHVERETALIAISQSNDRVQLKIKKSNNEEEAMEASFVIGCDGAHSAVRNLLNLPFKGGEFKGEKWLNGDVYAEWGGQDNEANMFSHKRSVLAVFPICKGRYRLISNYFHPDMYQENFTPTIALFQNLVNEYVTSPMKITGSVWLNTFNIHHRAVESMRVGNVFVAGDAAHIHSPAGGQGMNTGIQDAYNLAWKLALFLKGRANKKLLESYNAERLPIAESVIKMTNRLTQFITTRNPVAIFIRNWFIPIFLNLKILRLQLASNMAEIKINYRSSPIVEECESNSLKAGDRAPDMRLKCLDNAVESTLFDVIKGTEHHLLVFIDTSKMKAFEKVLQLCDTVRSQYHDAIIIDIIITGDEHPEKLSASYPNYVACENSSREQYHIKDNKIYLIRPDGYIGFHSSLDDAEKLKRYLSQILLK